MNNADKFAWKFLVDNGNVVGDWEYYGGCYNTYPKKTKECRSKIKTVGIDWNKTHPATDSMRSSFNGTFADTTFVKVMMGTLVLNDGSTWEWATSDIEPYDIIRAMAEYLPDPFEQ